VMTGPLLQFSRDPPTGFFRDGYCRTGPEDTGNHAIAATVSDEFLDFSAKNGNNLRDVGVKDGMKWCLCTNRWKEAMQAAQKGSLAESAVPKVHLHATDESALKMLSLNDLKKYKAEAEAPNEGRNNRQDSYRDPKMSKESNTANNHDSRGDQRGGHENGMRG
jgi:uncharacterized protein (DUF2237 family)